MKIYINNLNLTLLPEIQTYIQEHPSKRLEYMEVITNEGIYHVNHQSIQRLCPIDGNVKVFENYYKNITLIVDESSYNISNVHSIQGNKHIQETIVKHTYKTNKPNFYFVIEMVIRENNMMYGKDCYFETSTSALLDVNDPFVKQSIIEFLLLLT
jgi:hypothetical protein